MNNITYHPANELESAAKQLIIPTDIVLDVGCGIRPQTFFKPRVHIGVDAHYDYLVKLQESRPDIFPIHSLWDVVYELVNGSVDTVFALDFIEHIEIEEGFYFLKEICEIARSQVVIFTPIGFYPQTYNEGDVDRWGMNGGYWQTHRSGWTPEDFGDEWTILACKDYHKHDQHDQPLKTPIGAMYCIYTKE